jgi:hypothetical protein
LKEKVPEQSLLNKFENDANELSVDRFLKKYEEYEKEN